MEEGKTSVKEKVFWYFLAIVVIFASAFFGYTEIQYTKELENMRSIINDDTPDFPSGHNKVRPDQLRYTLEDVGVISSNEQLEEMIKGYVSENSVIMSSDNFDDSRSEIISSWTNELMNIAYDVQGIYSLEGVKSDGDDTEYVRPISTQFLFNYDPEKSPDNPDRSPDGYYVEGYRSFFAIRSIDVRNYASCDERCSRSDEFNVYDLKNNVDTIINMAVYKYGTSPDGSDVAAKFSSQYREYINDGINQTLNTLSVQMSNKVLGERFQRYFEELFVPPADERDVYQPWIELQQRMFSHRVGELPVVNIPRVVTPRSF